MKISKNTDQFNDKNLQTNLVLTWLLLARRLVVFRTLSANACIVIIHGPYILLSRNKYFKRMNERAGVTLNTFVTTTPSLVNFAPNSSKIYLESLRLRVKLEEMRTSCTNTFTKTCLVLLGFLPTFLVSSSDRRQDVLVVVNSCPGLQIKLREIQYFTTSKDGKQK